MTMFVVDIKHRYIIDVDVKKIDDVADYVVEISKQRKENAYDFLWSACVDEVESDFEVVGKLGYDFSRSTGEIYDDWFERRNKKNGSKKTSD